RKRGKSFVNNHQGPSNNRASRGQLVPAVQAVPVLRQPYGPLAGYGYGPGVTDGPEPFGLNLQKIWRVLDKRKWLILGIIAACVVIGAVRTLMETPIYTSTVRLQIDRPGNVVEHDANQTEESDYNYNFMTMQEEIIKSRLMAERVAAALK